jgi:hypothetical protein
MKNATMAIAHGLLGIALTGCLAGNNQQFFSSNFVCNTLGDKTGSGIKGKLYYLNQAEVAKGYSGVSDFLNRGTSPDVDFYLGRLFTPTRPFSEGFRLTNTGEVIKDASGQELIEHFAFHFTSKIQLPAGSADRRVQFALLSDDGSRVVIHRKNTDGSTTRVINVNNDGNHPTRLGCGSAPVTLSSSSPLSVEIDYYQGPRYHIALTLLWREWPTSGSTTDPRCGQSGSDLWFDSSTTPSTPQPAWNDLMTRWQVVPSEVFVPEPGNPCL